MVTSTHDRHASYHHGDLANALIATGITLAREGGPGAVQLRETAGRIGVSPTAACRHFRQRDDLRQAVRQQAAAQPAGAVAVGTCREAVPDALSRVRAICMSYVGFALAEPGLFRTAIAAPAGEQRQPRDQPSVAGRSTADPEPESDVCSECARHQQDDQLQG
jgi:AcrR family transcriptional regulator